MGRHLEVVIEGPRGLAHGFVLGYLAGRGQGGGVLDAEAEGFECASFRERLGELLHPGHEVAHLLVPETLLPEVRRGLEQAKQDGRPLTLRLTRPVEARLAFSFAIASRAHAARVRDMVAPRGGLRLSPLTVFKESQAPEAAGTELYAPAHAYEMRGRGAIEGSPREVLDLFRRCRDEELIELGRPELFEAVP